MNCRAMHARPGLLKIADDPFWEVLLLLISATSLSAGLSVTLAVTS